MAVCDVFVNVVVIVVSVLVVVVVSVVEIDVCVIVTDDRVAGVDVTVVLNVLVVSHAIGIIALIASTIVALATVAISAQFTNFL